VATADDLQGVGDVPVIPLPFARVPPFPPLARGRVAMVGTPIVAVVAESAAAARDGADLVEVDFEPQPAVAYAESALAPDAPRVHPELDSTDYALPRAGDMAPMLLDHAVTPTPLNPSGAKGVG